MSQANLLHSSSLPDLEGKFIDKGRLLLMSSLGCGTYGNVYRAVLVDSPKDQPRFYAVKCQKRASQGTSRDVFQRREIQLHQKVGNHPNIVSFHKAIYTERHIFCVLDVCEGVDLFRAIEEKRFVNNTALIKNAFMQISGAVQYCHDSGIYHRDIKPENILVSEDNRSLLLTDFGLSTRDRHSTQIGCGSKFYMSPECVGSRDFRIPRFDNLLNDIWSLGIVLTTLITRRLPWLCATLTDEHFSAYLSEPDFLLDALPISARTNNILRCVLHPNPSRRMTLNAFRRAVSNTDDFYVAVSGPAPTLALPAGISTFSGGSLFRERMLSEVLADAVTISLSGSARSKTSSPAPVTPDTHAAVVDLSVPDIETRFGEGVGIVGKVGSLLPQAKSANRKHVAAKLPSSIPRALQGIGRPSVLSGSTAPRRASDITTTRRPLGSSGPRRSSDTAPLRRSNVRNFFPAKRPKDGLSPPSHGSHIPRSGIPRRREYGPSGSTTPPFSQRTQIRKIHQVNKKLL